MSEYTKSNARLFPSWFVLGYDVDALVDDEYCEEAGPRGYHWLFVFDVGKNQ